MWWRKKDPLMNPHRVAARARLKTLLEGQSRSNNGVSGRDYLIQLANQSNSTVEEVVDRITKRCQNDI